MNPQEGDMTNIQVGEALQLPMCAGGDTFFVTAEDAPMVHDYGGWGIVYSKLFGRYPTPEEFTNKTIPVPAADIPDEVKAEAEALLTGIAPEKAGFPYWQLLLTLLGLLVVAGIILYTKMRENEARRRAELVQAHQEQLRLYREQLQRERSRPVRVVPGDPILSQDQMGTQADVAGVNEVGDYLERHLRQGPDNHDWTVDRSRLERGNFTGQLTVGFRGYLGELNQVEESERVLIFGEPTPTWRATIRNIRTGAERIIFVLMECANVAHTPVGEEVTDWTFEPETEKTSVEERISNEIQAGMDEVRSAVGEIYNNGHGHNNLAEALLAVRDALDSAIELARMQHEVERTSRS